jgi:hypothetical protein
MDIIIAYHSTVCAFCWMTVTVIIEQCHINQNCCPSNTVGKWRNCVSKPVCTVSCTTSNNIVISVALPMLPMLQTPALPLVDTTQSIMNCELPHTMAWVVTHLQCQMSDRTGDCHRSKYVTHWVILNWIFLYSLCTHTQGNWTNYEKTCLASNAYIHLKLAICLLCHIYSSLDLQQFEPVTFRHSNKAQWQCISFLAQTFME